MAMRDTNTIASTNQNKVQRNLPSLRTAIADFHQEEHQAARPPA